jgi:PAS domain S-box-containing protein
MWLVVPVWGGVEIVGFIFAELDFGAFVNETLRTRFGETGEAILVDYAGVPLHGEARDFLIAAMSRRPPERNVKNDGGRIGKEAYWVAIAQDGGLELWDRLACIVPVSSINQVRSRFDLPPWSLVVTQSPRESYAAMRNSVGSLWVAGMIGVLIVGLFGALIAWHITSPIKELREGVRLFARGERNRRVAVSSNDEIGELADEFNLMAERVTASEGELRAFAQAVEHAADAIVMTDLEGVIYYANPAFATVTGYAFEEIKGRTPSIQSSGRTPKKIYHEMWDTINSGNSWRGELYNRHKDGREYPVNLTISPVRDEHGKVVAHLGIHRDITPEREYQDRLEREVEARTREIAQTQGLTVMGRMASMVAHDLRNGLSTIKMNLQILHRRHSNEEGIELEHCKIGLGQVGYMEEILHDMLSYARPEKIRVDWHDLEKIIDESLVGVTPKIEKKQLRVLVNHGKGIPLVCCDRVKIIEVMQNLVENAVQASPLGSDILIETFLMMDSPRPQVQIRVGDTGEGIAEEVVAEIFEPFFTTRAKGTGLGLAIVKRIVEQHDGSIAVETKLDVGTTVRITLPTDPSGYEVS